MKENITAMYARKNFGRLLDKAALLGESYVIERAGRPMAALVAVDRLEEMQQGAEAMEAASEVIEKNLKAEKKAKKKAKIVIATVKGDLHDIGKNIVSLVLRNYGFEVIDLGKNVPSEKIVDTAEREKADFIGLSALMTTTMEEMGVVVSLKNKRIPKTKVFIGGAAVSPSFAREIGADAYCKDAMDTVKKIEKELEKN